MPTPNCTRIEMKRCGHCRTVKAISEFGLVKEGCGVRAKNADDLNTIGLTRGQRRNVLVVRF